MIHWYNFFREFVLVAIASIFTTSTSILNQGFSWLGLGVMLSGVAFVIVALIMRNYEEDKK